MFVPPYPLLQLPDLALQVVRLLVQLGSRDGRQTPPGLQSSLGLSRDNSSPTGTCSVPPVDIFVSGIDSHLPAS